MVSRAVSFAKGMPGRWRLRVAVSCGVSSLLVLYAGELRPRSAVCLNHVGSFEPNDSAMVSREGGCGASCSSVSSGWDSGVLCGERAALFSDARAERGRVREAEVEDEFGRLCQDMVLERDGMAALGEALDGLNGRSIDAGESRSSREEECGAAAKLLGRSKGLLSRGGVAEIGEA